MSVQLNNAPSSTRQQPTQRKKRKHFKVCVFVSVYVVMRPTPSPPSPASSFSTAASSSSSISSNYLTPTEIANHRRPAVTPLPSSVPVAPSVAHTHTGAAAPAHLNNNGGHHSDDNVPLFQSIMQGFENFPRIIWNIHPHVKLKLRKRFYPLGVTRLTVGADYDLRTHQTSFKWSWKDRVIGARLHVSREELAITKSFDVDVQTRLDFRASMDVRTHRTLLSMRVRPFGRVVADTADPGLIVRHKVPLDKHLAVQFAARVKLPEARFTAGSDAALSLGEGDFIVDLDELNFRFLLE